LLYNDDDYDREILLNKNVVDGSLTLDPEFATYVRELIAANQEIKTVVDTARGIIEVSKQIKIKLP
jgi:hypothetical protein